MHKQLFLAMNEINEEDLFYLDMSNPSDEKKDVNEDYDSQKKIQIGIRLDSSGSNMLARIKNWCLKKNLIEFLGEEGMGSAVASTDTTLARFILDAGIKALYSDVQNDELITEVAQWFKDGMTIGRVSFLLDSQYGLPSDLAKKIIALGSKRSEQIARSEEYANVKTQAERLDIKYEKDLEDIDDVLKELEDHQFYIENH